LSKENGENFRMLSRWVAINFHPNLGILWYFFYIDLQIEEFA